MHQQAGCRGAVLAGVIERGADDLLGCALQVGIGENDDRGLAAEFKVHALNVDGGRLCHLHACTNRTGDGNHLWNLVFDQCSTGVAIAGDHVEDALWQELRGDFGKQQAHGRGGV